MFSIIDGVEISKSIYSECEEKLKNLNKKLKLSVIQIGDDEASTIYANRKKKMCEKYGIDFEIYNFNIYSIETDIIDLINKLNNDDKVTGIFVEMPIPNNFNIKKISSSVKYTKDIDGISEISIARLVRDLDCLLPCTPAGIIEIIKRNNIEIEGKHCVILNRSDVIGKPLLHLLLKENATVTICNSKTKNIKDITNMADILIVAVNKQNFIDKSYIKQNAIVIDCGIHLNSDNKIIGDVNFDDVKNKCSYITKVPGGVGTVTTSMILKNIIKASELNG